ncbi:MAG: Flp pilus assembly complex ATPase component TadA [Ruminococcus sp.]|nr:Flp pilus assembly complex ATPase component TadA [Ruminococcus sp.]
MENKRKRFKSACLVLPPDIQSVLLKAPDFISNDAQEIVLRVNRPLSVECPKKRYYFTQNNCVTDTLLNQQMLVTPSRAIFETFQNICNYSIYSRQNEINNGFITLRYGHRAGLCGTAVVNDKKIVNIKDITTINIRIANEIIGCADKLSALVNPLEGVLICGAPCSGKTTLLRDFARSLSYDYKVSLIDERNELSSTVSGVFYNDVGLCDVFDGYIKDDAIIQSVRCMSPDIIVCDEISSVLDIATIERCVNSGVAFVATIHADSLDTMLKRPAIKKLLKTGAFSKLVFLDTRQNAGQVKSVVNLNEIDGVLLD